MLIADEPTTALDVTIQAQILERIREMRDETGAAVILVTHDLGVVADIADRVAVMYAGRIVEHGTLDEVFYDPQHPYTWGLLGSIARVDRDRPDRLPAIAGMPPSLADRPEGCHFRPRCPHAFGKCSETPALEHRGGASAGHLDRCWLDADEKRELRMVERPDRAGRTRGNAGVSATNGAPLLEVEHLKLHFPIKEGVVFDREVGARARGGRRDVRAARGRDAGAGGRVGLREDDARRGR